MVGHCLFKCCFHKAMQSRNSSRHCLDALSIAMWNFIICIKPCHVIRTGNFNAVARGPTSRMFILSAVLEIRPVGCTFQALGYISERSRAKRRKHGEQLSFVCFKLRIFQPYFSLYMSQHMILIKSSKSGIIM